MSLRIAWLTQTATAHIKDRELFVCATAAFNHHQCIFGSFTLLPVRGTLSLDTVLQDPRVGVDLLKGQSLVRVQYKQL